MENEDKEDIIKSYCAEKKELKDTLNVLNGDVNQVRNMATSLENKIRQKSSKIESLKEQLEGMKKSSRSEGKAYQLEIRTLKAFQEELEQLASDMKTENESLRLELKGVLERRGALQKELDTTVTFLDKQRERIMQDALIPLTAVVVCVVVCCLRVKIFELLRDLFRITRAGIFGW